LFTAPPPLSPTTSVSTVCASPCPLLLLTCLLPVSVLHVWMGHLHRFIPCPKCRKEIPERLVCGGYRNSTNAGLLYRRVRVYIFQPLFSFLRSYIRCSCGWFEWLSPHSSVYTSTRSPPPEDEFPVNTVEPYIFPMLDPSLEPRGADMDYDYDPAWFKRITPLTPPLPPTPTLAPAVSSMHHHALRRSPTLPPSAPSPTDSAVLRRLG
jgi:hypothetical protein